MNQITTPNLFDYATKELAQDAALAYILAWAHPSYQNKQHRPLNELGTGMLRAMLASQRSEFANLNVTSIGDRCSVKKVRYVQIISYFSIYDTK